MDAARRADVAIASLSVQSTTLDDVFVHFTGRQLRDALQAPIAAESPFIIRARLKRMKDSLNRILALIERDLRRFRRSPTLIVVSMIMPLIQLVVLGYAFGGKIKNLEVGVVDQDHRARPCA